MASLGAALEGGGPPARQPAAADADARSASDSLVAGRPLGRRARRPAELIDAADALPPSGVAALPRRRGPSSRSARDPDGGFVVIYELRDAAAAAAAGPELAAYLGPGPGQMNFPTDAQPSSAQVGATLIFYAGRRSRRDPRRRSRASDREGGIASE